MNEQVMVCSAGPNTPVTSRKPDDLDAFCSSRGAVFAGKPALARS